jgi:predicted P-loop ATPase/GTPase
VSALTRILVVSGLIPIDSGKTWFTLGLADALRSVGFSVGVYKPVAAHNLWFNPRTLYRSSALGVLAGNDILAYYDREVVSDIARANPIALALAPRDLLTTSSVDEYLESFENLSKILVLARITQCSSGSVEHLVIRENLEKTPPILRRRIEELARDLGCRDSSVSEVLGYLRSNESTRNLEECLNILARSVDVVVVESFNDAVVPFSSLLEELSYLIIVTPGYALLYTDRDLVKEAVNKVTRDLGDEGYRAKYLVERVKPSRVLYTEILVEPTTSSVHLELARSIAGSEVYKST